MSDMAPGPPNTANSIRKNREGGFGIARQNGRYYHMGVQTISLKLTDDLLDNLTRKARARRVTKSALLERGVILIAIDIQDQQADLRALMHRYRNRPMSLADACLVRLSELHADGEIFTLDADFHIYRRHGNKVIPVLMPE